MSFKILISALIAVCFSSFAQWPEYQKVDLRDFEKTGQDSTTPVVFLYNYCHTRVFEQKGVYKTEKTIYQRFKINTIEGLKYAKIKLFAYKNKQGKSDKISEIEGVVFRNIGKNIYQNNLLNSHIQVANFNSNPEEIIINMPQAAVDDIIEIKYKILIPSVFVDTWYFQTENPVLWSEMQLELPVGLKALTSLHGFHPFFINNASTEIVSKKSDDSITKYRWVIKDIEGFKSDAYIKSNDDLISNLQFDIYFEDADHAISWPQADQFLLLHPNFGRQILYWGLNNITQIADYEIDDLQKAIKVYNYIRDSITCTERKGIYAENVKKCLKNQAGTATEINLLLASVLQKINKDWRVSPFIVPSRYKGQLNELQPEIDKCDQVLVYLQIKDAEYFLDASDKLLSFGQTFNNISGQIGRVVRFEDSKFCLVPPSNQLSFRESTIWFSNDSCLVQSKIVYNRHYSLALRDRYLDQKQLEDYQRQNLTNSSCKIQNFEFLDSLISVTQAFKIPISKSSDTISVTCFPFKWLTSNPFEPTNRVYPVEFDNNFEVIDKVTIEVPIGYEIAKKPQNLHLILTNRSMKYLYQTETVGQKLLISSVQKTYTPKIEASDYPELRILFENIIKKESEKVRLIKTK